MAAARLLRGLPGFRALLRQAPLFQQAAGPLGWRRSAWHTDKDSGSLTRCGESSVTTDWRKKLTPEQFYVTRDKGTELARHETAKMKEPLEAKYDSGTGWPSFSEAYGSRGTDESNTNILRRPDHSSGFSRTEVVCKKCDAHLGHVFSDGPKPSGQRFCINSISLTFKPSSTE